MTQSMRPGHAQCPRHLLTRLSGQLDAGLYRAVPAQRARHQLGDDLAAEVESEYSTPESGAMSLKRLAQRLFWRLRLSGALKHATHRPQVLFQLLLQFPKDGLNLFQPA